MSIIFLFSYLYNVDKKYACMIIIIDIIIIIIIIILCHHSEYSRGLLHIEKIFTWGLGFMMQ